MHYEGDPIDVSKLPKDYDVDELNYDPETVYKPKLRKTTKKIRYLLRKSDKAGKAK